MQKKKSQVSWFPTLHLTTQLTPILSGRHRWVDLAQVRCFNSNTGYRARASGPFADGQSCGRLSAACKLTHEPSTNTTPPKCPQSGTHGSRISATIHQSRTRRYRSIHHPGNWSVFSSPSVGAYLLTQTRSRIWRT